MKDTHGCIVVVPVGHLPSAALEAVSHHLGRCVGLDTSVCPPMHLPDRAFDERRSQYNVLRLIEALEERGFGEELKVVAVLNVDLFIPIFTHVFGEAQEGGKFALVSLFRLSQNEDGTRCPPHTLLERLAKVSVHEAGHLFDLVHCADPACLMHFSGTVSDLDAITLTLCRYCHEFLNEALRRWKMGPCAPGGAP